MKRYAIFALGLVGVAALGGTVWAAGQKHGGGHGPGAAAGGMHEMMQRMMGSDGMQGMMGGGMMGGGGMMMTPMFQAFDADDDGKVSPDELRAGLKGKLAEYDADGNGTLSIAEFETLHSAAIRERMVDRFQMLDNDGDGQVTEAEMTAMADRMERMMDRREKMLEMMRDMRDDGDDDDVGRRPGHGGMGGGSRSNSDE